jgi:hypothetical protein
MTEVLSMVSGLRELEVGKSAFENYRFFSLEKMALPRKLMRDFL